MKVGTVVELSSDEVDKAIIEKARELAKLNAEDKTVGNAHVEWRPAENNLSREVTISFTRTRG